MGDPSLDGYGKKLVNQLISLANKLDAVLLHRVLFQHGGREENTPSFPAKSARQSRVIELANDARVQLVATEPAFQLLTH